MLEDHAAYSSSVTSRCCSSNRLARPSPLSSSSRFVSGEDPSWLRVVVDLERDDAADSASAGTCTTACSVVVLALNALYKKGERSWFAIHNDLWS